MLQTRFVSHHPITVECWLYSLKLLIEVVEIDQAIVSVATDWFGFVSDSQLTVHVADGLDYIKKLHAEGIESPVLHFTSPLYQQAIF